MGAEIGPSAPSLDLIIDLISSCDQDEGGQLGCSFLHDAASEKRTEDEAPDLVSSDDETEEPGAAGASGG